MLLTLESVNNYITLILNLLFFKCILFFSLKLRRCGRTKYLEVDLQRCVGVSASSHLVYHAPRLLFLRVSVLQLNSVGALVAVVVVCLPCSSSGSSSHNRVVLAWAGGATCCQAGTGWAAPDTWVLWSLFEKDAGGCRGSCSHCSWYWSWDLT